MADPIWKQKGFKSYYAYRTYLAQLQGYTGYAQQRKARAVSKTGDFSLLKGTDVDQYGGGLTTPNLPPRAPRAVSSASGPKPEMPSNSALPRTRLYQYDAQTAEIANSLISRKKFDGRFPKAETVSKRAITTGKKEVATHFPDEFSMSNGNSFVAAAYRQGLEQASPPGTDVKSIMNAAVSQPWNPRSDETQFEALARMNQDVRSELMHGLDTFHRNARQWDARASRVTNAREAKRMAKDRIFAYENANRTWRTGLKEMEEAKLSEVKVNAYTMGLVEGYRRQGVLYYRVFDGPECGWENHKDPQKANGMVVTADEALGHPQAHNWCVRRFEPILDPNKGKESYEEEKKKRLSAADKKISTAAKATVVGVAASAALLGLTAEITTPAFQGTVGNFILNGMAEGLRTAMARMADLKNRAVAVLARRFAALGFDNRLEQVAAQIASEQGISVDDAKRGIAEQIHREAAEFNTEAAEGQGQLISLLTRRVVGVSEKTPLRVVGDDLDMWERYYKFRFKNEVIDNSPGAAQLAQLLNDQSFISQALYNSTRFKGRFLRFSLPRINTIDGNTGERLTTRYARVALSPNRLAHVHVSARPYEEGRLRILTNLKINPNGMVRMGFVKGEDGIIRPNLSLVPKGPLRVYSRANRAGKYVTKQMDGWEYVKLSDAVKRPDYIDGAGISRIIDPLSGQESRIINGIVEETGQSISDLPDLVLTHYRRNERILNINAGRVNSITTEVRLLTRWSPVTDHAWYKFRVNIQALGIKKPSDIKNLTIYDFRRWAEEQHGERFDWLSAGVRLHLKGGNLFDFARTLRIDPTTQYRIRNVEKNLDGIMSVFTEGVRGTAAETGAWGGKPLAYDPVTGLPVRPSKLADAGVPPGTSSYYVSGTRGATQGRAEGQSMKSFLGDQVVNVAEAYLRTKAAWNDVDISSMQDELDDLIKLTEATENNALREALLRRHSPWQIAQAKWDLVKKEMESRYEQLTDYFITMQRADAIPSTSREMAQRMRSGNTGVLKLLQDLYQGNISESDLNFDEERFYWTKPDLVVAVLEADPKLVAQDLAKRFGTFEDLQLAVRESIARQWQVYRNFMPEAVRKRVDGRIAADMLLSEDASMLNGVRLNITDTFRFHDDVERVFEAGSTRNLEYSLRKGFRPGDQFAKDNYGRLRLFTSTPDSLKGTEQREIVEFVVDGVSRQRYRDGIPYLEGDYDVVGYSYMARNGVGSIHPFPKDMPDAVQVVHRIYLRQRGVVRDDLDIFTNSIVDEGLLDALDHADRLETLRKAYPFEVDALEEYLMRPKEIADAMRGMGTTRDMILADTIKQLISKSNPIPNNLYRVFTGDLGEEVMQDILNKPTFTDILGTWAVTTDKFPASGSETQPRVVVVLRNARGINLGPITPDPTELIEFLTSGVYRLSKRYDDLTTNSTWLFLDYVRPAR